MMQRLSKRDMLLIGFTLFSMFFGAGNLIFPPFLGAKAGELALPAMGGFLISAVGLPVLGVAAVAMSGGLSSLAGRVHPKFAALFTLLIYLSIGPGLAIPRTASTSFEMAVLPYLGYGAVSQQLASVAYSVVFFAAAMALAFRPDRLTDTLGRVLCPTLLILIAVIFTGCLIWPMGSAGAADASYSQGAAVTGFLEGYQTMDTIAALNFGIVISLNIRAKGVKEDYAVVRETIKAGMIAGVMMALVYGALAYVGAPAGPLLPEADNGAKILTFVAGSLFGQLGMMLLGLIFFIACLNTCVGLLSCCSEYFTTIFPRIGYRAWVAVFAAVSLVIANAGLTKILEISVPVLNAIYPVAIVLIALAFLERWIGGKRFVYPCSILLTGVVSLFYAADQAGVIWSGAAFDMGALLPGYSQGLGWMIPAAAGLALGVVLDRLMPAEGEKD